MYAPANTCVKSSIFLLYLRIFSMSKGTRRFAWAVIVFIAAFYVASALVVLFSCQPWKKRLNPLLPGKCVNTYYIAVSSTIHNIIVDIIAFILPIGKVLQLKISSREKIQVMAVFAAGFL